MKRFLLCTLTVLLLLPLFCSCVMLGGKEETLTASEADLLGCLSSKPGKPFTADEILSFLRGDNYIGDPATVRMHVMNLRRKLGKAGGMIANLPGGGYYLVGK